MDKKKNYLALVNKDFILTDEVVEYFNSKDIDVIKYLKTIGVLKLKSHKDLTSKKLKFIDHIEEDREFRSSPEEG